MRRSALAISLFLLLAPACARANDWVGAPITHGPDFAGIDAGPQAPAPQGGPVGAVAESGKTLTRHAVQKRLPTTWCGAERATDDTADETQNGGFKEHAIYMIPADGQDHFAAVATTLQTDAFEASALLETAYNRAIRFDMGTNCGPQYLDISVVRMPQTAAQLQAAATSPDGTYNAVNDALARAGFQPIQPTDTLEQAAARTRNWVVWLDGPAPPDTCGQASIYDDPTRADTNLNNDGGKIAMIFPDGDGSFCGSNAVRHEIGHNLGALQPEAPHAFDGAHCNDAIEDTMCYSNSPQVANGQPGLFFDYHNDDYWSPPGGAALPWWTVDENRFLCSDASCNVAPGAINDPPPNTQAPAPAPAPRTAPAPKAHLSLHVKRLKSGRWRVSLRATGAGKAVVAVRCRRTRRGQVRTVFTRRTVLPRSIVRRVRCGAGRPRGLLFTGNGA